LTQTLARYNPEKAIVFSRDEMNAARMSTRTCGVGASGISAGNDYVCDLLLDFV